MSEPRLISPLLDDFVMGGPISDHHGVRCCPAMTKHGDNRYIVKVISIPASQVQVEALLLAGAYKSQASALAYFKELAEGVTEEAEILKKLSKFEGFVPYENFQIVPMEEKIGYEVYLLSPYKRSLERHLRKKPITHLGAVNLGLDLCASMVMCRRAGFLYVDLKPGNIFINQKNEYCVGDLGFIRLSSLKYASLPDKYRSAYTAPELSDAMASLNETLDTYAIGKILYQIYNDGKLPAEGEPLTPPAFADYEMAEIILKAIAPDPSHRWPDPMQMGQALVAYMQRNDVNDVPIVPLPEPEPEPIPVEAEPEAVLTEADTPAEAEEPAAEEEVSDDPDASVEEAAESGEDETPAPEEAASEPKEEPDVTDLGFMEDMVSDETAPDAEDAEDVDYEELSEDTSDILAQADELLAMEVPEPVVAPEPIDIPTPEPLVLTDDPESEAEESTPAAEAVPEDPSAEAEDFQTEEPAAEDPVPEEEAKDEEYEDEDYEDVEEPEPEKHIGFGRILAGVLALVLLIGALGGGYFYYQNIYLQHIDKLEITGANNTLTVVITSDAQEGLLTVTCTDSYGNTHSSPVVNGKAQFENLAADTIYKISVTMDGFHTLQGQTSGSYTTPAQTNIVSFEATAGSEEGSVILTFTIDGKDSDFWTVTYTAAGENEKSETFSGHMVSISSLTPGKEYTFYLSSEDLAYLVGQYTVTHTPEALIFAENLTVSDNTAEGITIAWTAPANTIVNSWTVRCFNENGYDESITTGDLTVTFTGTNPAENYTVEVIAEGMSAGVRSYITAQAVTLTEVLVDTQQPMKITASWTVEGNIPEGGWLLQYSIDGVAQEALPLTENTVTIYPAMPGDEYSFTLLSADGTTVLNNNFTAKAPAVQVFKGYGITADNMSFRLCRTPDKENWKYSDLRSSDYTSVFSVGQKASFVVHLDKKCDSSEDPIEALFVVRDQNGTVVCTSSSSASWNDLWNNRYCELDIPALPEIAGTYKIAVYFNGMAVCQDTLTVR